jgi:hypothetical protein
MKISVGINGEVILTDINGDTKEAMKLIREIQDSNRKQLANVVQDDLVDHSVELNASLYEAWAFLCDHDCDGGIPVQGMARALKTSAGAISHRMCELQRRGYAKRVARGYYRAQIP